MSRKRKQSKRAAPAPVEAVPEEILAEGSGPVGPGDAVELAAGSSAVELAEGSSATELAEPPSATELAEAADAVGRRRRKRRAPEQAAGASTASAPSDQTDEVSVDGEAGTSDRVDLAGEGAAGFVAVAADFADPADAAQDVDAGSAATEDEAAVDPEAATADDVDGELAAQPGDADAGPALADAEPGDAGAEPALAAAEPGDAAAEPALADAEPGEASAAGDDAGEAGAALPTSAASMDAAQLKCLVEALIFASDKPLTIVRLRQLTRVSDTKRLEQTLEGIAEDFRERGIVLQQVSGGYQFRTRTQFSAWVQQLIAGRPVRLSRAQLETLAIIAYRQPITRPEIDEIRGVDSSATLKLLIDRALIRTLGKKEEVGRPMLYGTTKEFLDFFSLGDLRELPTLREYSELTDESRQVMSARLGIELDDAARPVDASSEGAAGETGAGEHGDGEGGADEGEASLDTELSGEGEVIFDAGASVEGEVVFDAAASVEGEVVFDAGASSEGEVVFDAAASVEGEVSLDAAPSGEGEVSESEPSADAAPSVEVEASLGGGESPDEGGFGAEPADEGGLAAEALGGGPDLEAAAVISEERGVIEPAEDPGQVEMSHVGEVPTVGAVQPELEQGAEGPLDPAPE